MSDGPFKNTRLGSRWKRFAAATYNDAVDDTDRYALASDALTHEILTAENQSLLSDLQAYTKGPQLDLDSLSSIEGIFGDHSKTAFGDRIQREMAFRMGDHTTLSDAFEQALEASVDDQINRARSRIQEECIRARECGELRQQEFDDTVNRATAAFDGLSKSNIYDAVRAGDKNAFKKYVSKKTGLDEGPNL